MGTSVITGLDKDKLINVANAYGINLGKYMRFVTQYEIEMMKQESANT